MDMKREHRVTIRLTDIEFSIIENAAEQAEMSISEYMRTQTMEGNVTARFEIVADVDVLVPSYGYCPIPPCTPYTGGDVCPGVFDLPLYPTAVSPQSQNAR